MAIDYRYPPEAYIPAAVRYGYIDLSEARAEYSRLRSIAVKRLERLSRTEGRKYSAYKMYGKEGFSPLPKNATPAEVGHALADVHHFLNLKTSLISQIRQSQREALSTLQERGYDFLDKSNIKEFGEFMESAREAKIVSTNRGGSPIIAELYATVKRLQIPIEEVKQNFLEYLSKRKELERLPTPEPGEKSMTLDEIREHVGLSSIEVREKMKELQRQAAEKERKKRSRKKRV